MVLNVMFELLKGPGSTEEKDVYDRPQTKHATTTTATASATAPSSHGGSCGTSWSANEQRGKDARAGEAVEATTADEASSNE